MPSLGLGPDLTRPSDGAVEDFDSDASTYFATAGVTDATAKARINLFVVGLKTNGWWNNAACWLFRSTQNAGSGTTAYKLGGLAGNNGALVNSPIWDTTGLIFSRTGGTHVIVGNSPSSLTDITVVSAVNRSETGQYHGIGCGRINSDFWAFGYDPSNNLFPQDPAAIGTIAAPASGTWGTAIMGSSTTTGGFFTIDAATALVAPNMNAVASDIYISALKNGPTSFPFNGTMAYFILLNTKLSEANAQVLRNLASSTIGAGLGIP